MIMIQANELRIGNWVTYNQESVDKGTEIIPIKVPCINVEAAVSLDDGFTNSYFFNEINPIPLTPEILVKCGFKKLNNAWVPIDYSATDYLKWSFTIWDNKDGTYRYNSAEFIPELKYLHQLQNLYYALTGEELIYKP